MDALVRGAEVSNTAIVLDPKVIDEVFDLYGLQNVVARGLVEEIFSGDFHSEADLRRQLVDVFTSATDPSVFNQLGTPGEAGVAVASLNYRNPFNAVLEIALSAWAGVQGVVWAIEKYQSIRKTALEIRKLQRGEEPREAATREQLSPADRQRDAVLQNALENAPKASDAIIVAVVSVQLRTDIAPATQSTELIKKSAENLEALPSNLQIDVARDDE